MTVPGKASNTGLIKASADTVWRVLIDWGQLMDWYPNDPENGLVPLLKTELDGERGSVPVTRVMHVPDAPAIRETLEQRDDVARRIYYSLPNVGGMAGIRNYWATTFVESLGPKECRVSCASFFDVDDPDKVDDIASFFSEVVYARAVIGGLRAYCEAQ